VVVVTVAGRGLRSVIGFAVATGAGGVEIAASVAGDAGSVTGAGVTVGATGVAAGVITAAGLRSLKTF
jgi:hypothetical protein